MFLSRRIYFFCDCERTVSLNCHLGKVSYVLIWRRGVVIITQHHIIVGISNVGFEGYSHSNEFPFIWRVYTLIAYSTNDFQISNLDINLGSLQNYLYTTIKYIKAMLDIFLHTSIQNAHHLPHMVMTVICISHDKRHTQVLP